MTRVTIVSNETGQQNFGAIVNGLIIGATDIRIASGYAGYKAFEVTAALLKRCLANGARVQLIFGLGFWEGISQNMERALRSFDEEARSYSNGSGVYFCQVEKFHGKFYLLNSNGAQHALIGSSNFSDSGFGGWLEANAALDNPRQIDELNDYFERLLSHNARPIKQLAFPDVRGDFIKANRTAPATRATLTGTELQLPVAFTLTLLVRPQSHFNLFAGSGRRKSGIFKLRSWYEVEIGVTKQTRDARLDAILPAQLTPFRIQIVEDNGKTYEGLFKRKTSKKNERKTLRETSVDFMSAERQLFGNYIKNKLVSIGLMRYGDLLTEDVLSQYGTDKVVFRRLPSGVNDYLVTF